MACAPERILAPPVGHRDVLLCRAQGCHGIHLFPDVAKEARGKGGCRAHQGRDGMTNEAAGWPLGARTHQNGPALLIIGRPTASAVISKNRKI